MKNFLLFLQRKLSDIARDDDLRLKYQYRATYIILGLVSAFMSVVNIFTGKYPLLISTLAFAILCLINAVLATGSEKRLHVSTILFRIEFIGLLTFFIISGTPEGFSAIWSAMIPTCGLLLFKRKNGSLLSGIMFLIIIFLFWTDTGRNLLQYNYTESFMLRFPMLYAAFFAMAFFLESVRQATFENYVFFYSHDTLTGALNRKGFSDHAGKILKDKELKTIGFMIADLDKFKKVNDTYGHFSGDVVLMETAKRLNEITGAPICRWGGEEFAAIFPGGIREDNLETVRAIFEAEAITAEGKKILQTISIGAVNAEMSPSITMDKLSIEADKCLYEAKGKGRNKVVVRSFS